MPLLYLFEPSITGDNQIYHVQEEEAICPCDSLLGAHRCYYRILPKIQVSKLYMLHAAIPFPEAVLIQRLRRHARYVSTGQAFLFKWFMQVIP